jgi:hypothetical protein
LRLNSTCSFTDDWINITTGYGNRDSRGYQYNIYYNQGCNAVFSSNYFLTAANFNDCAGNAGGALVPEYFTGSCGASNEEMTYFAMPFKTGPAGYVYYQYEPDGWSWWLNEDYGYYELHDTGSYVSLLGTPEGSLNLLPETEYVFYVEGRRNQANYTSVNINISVNAYDPDWLYTEWSECSSGQQFRTKSDPLGKIPSQVEYRGCFDTALEDVLLGFEEGKSPSPGNVKKCELFYYPFCVEGYTTLTSYIEYPDNWNVPNSGQVYFLEMTGEAATQGSRSLKMWYVPPMWRFVYPGSICNETNEGAIPQVYKGLNDTLFVEYNITFPSTYMTIDYDVKRCQYPVTQYDGWCGKQCYGYQGNCSDSSVKGEYVSILTNPTTGEDIYEFYDEAGLSWETKSIDLSYSNITVGETYNLAFAVYPRYITDAYGHCIYIDNVRLSVRSAELTCEDNYCVGYDLYRPKQLNQSCVYEIEYNSPECLEEEDRILAEQFQDYCTDQTLRHYNNDTQEWESTVNATVCIEEEAEDSISEPLNFLEQVGLAYIEPFVGDSWPFFALFLTPLFLAFGAALGVSAFIVDRIKVNSGEGIIFGISFNGMLGVMSLIGWFPAWFTLVMIILSGAIISWQIFGKS